VNVPLEGSDDLCVTLFCCGFVPLLRNSGDVLKPLFAVLNLYTAFASGDKLSVCRLYPLVPHPQIG